MEHPLDLQPAGIIEGPGSRGQLSWVSILQVSGRFFSAVRPSLQNLGAKHQPAEHVSGIVCGKWCSCVFVHVFFLSFFLGGGRRILFWLVKTEANAFLGPQKEAQVVSGWCTHSLPLHAQHQAVCRGPSLPSDVWRWFRLLRNRTFQPSFSLGIAPSNMASVSFLFVSPNKNTQKGYRDTARSGRCVLFLIFLFGCLRESQEEHAPQLCWA